MTKLWSSMRDAFAGDDFLIREFGLFELLSEKIERQVRDYFVLHLPLFF